MVDPQVAVDSGLYDEDHCFTCFPEGGTSARDRSPVEEDELGSGLVSIVLSDDTEPPSPAVAGATGIAVAGPVEEGGGLPFTEQRQQTTTRFWYSNERVTSWAAFWYVVFGFQSTQVIKRGWRAPLVEDDAPPLQASLRYAAVMRRVDAALAVREARVPGGRISLPALLWDVSGGALCTAVGLGCIHGLLSTARCG